MLTVTDSFTLERLAVKIARSLQTRSTTEELYQVIATRGAPRTIQVDNGTEFTSNFNSRAYFRGTDVYFIRPGKAVDKARLDRSRVRLAPPRVDAGRAHS